MAVEPPVKNPLDQTVEFEEDSDFVPEEIKELELSNISLPDEKLGNVLSIVNETEVKILDVLKKQLAETQQQLANQERLNGLLVASIAEMLFRQIAAMPKEIQALVLAVLAQRIVP